MSAAAEFRVSGGVNVARARDLTKSYIYACATLENPKP